MRGSHQLICIRPPCTRRFQDLIGRCDREGAVTLEIDRLAFIDDMTRDQFYDVTMSIHHEAFDAAGDVVRRRRSALRIAFGLCLSFRSAVHARIFAFDEEYYHDDRRDVDPAGLYTRPMIEAAILREPVHEHTKANQAMQLTAKQPAIYAVCRRRRMLRPRCAEARGKLILCLVR